MCLPPPPLPPAPFSFFLSVPPIQLLVFIHFITPASGNVAFCVLNLHELRVGKHEVLSFIVYLFIYLFIVYLTTLSEPVIYVEANYGLLP